MARHDVSRGPSPRTNIKIRSTRFIGREAELAALHARLASRMVVVLGPPGVGKTRLAHEYALRHAEEYPGGTWLCDLTDAAGVDGICAGLGCTLDVPLVGVDGAAMVSQLADALAARGPLLLVLNDFEDVVAHAPATLAIFRERAPEARFLITSRVRTELEGEAVLDLGPLPLPESDADAGSSEAVQLFVDRARLVAQDYAITPDEAPCVAALARQLDGLPLAIELAAARMRVFSTATLLDGLRRGFNVLVKGPRASRGRHASLRGAIEASWAGLDAREQAALAQCSVFRGGFDLRAAERVLDLDDGAPSVADLLQALRDHSLLGRDGGRFALYLSVRDFVWEKLCEAGSVDTMTARHAAYYLAEGGARAAMVDGPEGIEARRWLAAELENLRAVHTRALARRAEGGERLAEAAQAALALQPLLASRGPLSQCMALLDPVLQEAPTELFDPSLRARLLVARADVHRLLGNLERSLADAEAARAIAAEHRDWSTLGAALVTLAYNSSQLGDLERARAYVEQTRALSEGGQRRLEGRVLTLMGFVEVLAGSLAEGRPLLRRALPIHRAAGDAWYEGTTLGMLCMAEGKLGNQKAARRYGERSVRILRAAGLRRPEVSALLNLGAVAMDQGRLDAARELLEEGLAAARGFGERSQLARYVLPYLGAAHFLAGRLGDARSVLEEALRGVDTADVPSGRAYLWLGSVESAEGNVEEARAAFDAAERAPADHRDNDRVLPLHRGLLELALAREAAAAGDAARADAHRAEARRRFAHAEPASANHYLRMARRALEQAIEADARDRAEKAPALLVHPRGEWFQLPSGGGRIDCSPRPLIGRLLVALTAHRLAAPGAPLSVDALVAEGWPGERMLSSAALSRLRVAVSDLRKMGPGTLLINRANGYLLDPRVPARFTEGDTPALEPEAAEAEAPKA